jgi:hypothetical protein
MILLLRTRATPAQIAEMLAELEVYIKVAVDIQRGVLVGGGALHVDCEAVLLDDGSQQTDIWGANWLPVTQEVRFEAPINLRPPQNSAMTILDAAVRQQVAKIVREILENV